MDPLLDAMLASSKEGIPPWAYSPSAGRPSVNNPEVAARRFAAPTPSAAIANNVRTGLEDATEDKTFAGKAARLVAKLLWGSPREETTKLGDNPQAAIGEALNVWNPVGGMAGVLTNKAGTPELMKSLKQAIEAKAAGWPSQKIWDKLGWDQNAAGQWVRQIPDDSLRLTARAQEALGGGAPMRDAPLKDVVNWPELFQTHPETAGLLTTIAKGEFAGSYLPRVAQGGARMKLQGQTPEQALEALQHEGSHAVSDVAGMPAGSNPTASTMQEIQRVKSTPTSVKDLEDPAFAAYWRQAGEVGARNEAARFVDPDLRKLAPSVTEDVPRMLQTIKFMQETSPQLAVKEKGGMWHPEAAERLSNPLAKNLRGNGADQLAAMNARFDALREKLGRTATPEELEAAFPSTDTWSQRAIRNYLNKHAGTASDPLKDIMLPSGRRWEQATDDMIRSRPAEDYPMLPSAQGAPRREPIYNDEGVGGHNEIKGYLSHVGDYLRQNVPPDKLQQYDLVRAVKETAANDARVAKEMEKASAASTKDLPVYKEYPDGMKWVELKLPEKLTEGQMKGVRKEKLKADRTIEGEIGEMPISLKAGDEIYSAIGADGKPIRNSYTNELAQAGDPETAHLAGQLAQEGNQMGHCVGGYCEGVASGESRIFSLRDGKGKSHVTIEVEPRREQDFRFKGRDEPFRAVVKHTDDIVQIKGKQNRAPVAEYLPYVQDFVKSGKWGEVGDLGNTGLMRHSKTGAFATPEELNRMLKEDRVWWRSYAD